jgi:hypothetical protein
MFKKHLILFIAGLLLLTGFFLLPQNRQWADERIISYYRQFQLQKKHLGLETRMKRRFDNAYIFSKNIADELKTKGADHQALVLLPTTGYFTGKNINYPVPEPSVFYYYTGINTTKPHYNNAMNANWYVRADKGKIIVDSIIDKKSLQDTIAAFLKWKRPYE